jgi:hypothetical protein
MARPFSSVAALAAAVAFAAACSDDSPTLSPSDGPSFVRTSPNACTFNGNPSLSGAIGDYFTVNSEKDSANFYATAIQTAYNSATPPNFTAARGPGFNLLKFVGKVARASHGSSTTNGAAVIRQTLQCMYDVPAATGDGQAFEGWPTAEQFDFKSALEFADGGAYFVRGDATGKDDQTAPLVAQLSGSGFETAEDGNVSVLATGTGATWSETLDERVLIYGNLFPTPPDPQPTTYQPTGYDWKFIPRSATFDPNGVVALCPGLGIDFDDADMIIQAGVGVLNFIDASTLCESSSVVALQGRSLLQRMSHFAVRALSPEPAYATASLRLATGGGLGGAKGDVFSATPVTNVTLEWLQKPPAVMRVGQSYTAIAGASTLVNGVKTYVNGTCLFITGTNNNGTGTELNGSKSCGTPSSVQVSSATTFRTPPKADPGFATFTLIPKKTGGLSLTLSAVALVSLGGVDGNNTLVAKTNVKP